jgi:hypothetical protein
MKAVVLLSAVTFSACISAASSSLAADTVTADPNPPQKTKNWTPPPKKILAQALSDDIMTSHPELISVTFHGVPPGQQETYTMFAGSYPHRIGNPDDPDDIDVITKGITIVDPRWHRVHDTQKKFVVQLPLRDAGGENVGLLVLAYKNEADSGKTEKDFYLSAIALRDGLQKRIPTYAKLYEPAKQH